MEIDREIIQRINELRENAYTNFRGNSTLAALGYVVNRLSFGLMELLTYKSGIKSKLRKRRVIRSLDILEQAFELGYTPGGGSGLPKEWSEMTLETCLDMLHPENKNYLEELSTNLFERKKAREEYKKIYGKDFLIPVKEKPTGKYRLYMTPEAMMDLIDPQPMKNPLREIKWGRQDKHYWLDWSRELRQYI